MKEQIIDTVALATQDVVDTIGVYLDKIDTLETVVTVESVLLGAAVIVATWLGMKIHNYKKNGLSI